MGDILSFLSESPAVDQTSEPQEKGIVDFLAQPDPLPSTIEKGLVTPPDQAAKVVRLQAKTGLPQGVIERNIEYIEAESSKQDFNPTEFRKNNPKFADWMAKDKNHVALAKTDIDGMSAIETAWDVAKGVPSSFAAFAPRFNAAAWGTVGEAMDLLGLGETTFAKEAWGAATRQTKLAESLHAHEQSFVAKAVGSGLESVGTTLVTLPFAIRSQATALTAMGLQAAGGAFQQGKEAGKDPYINLLFGLSQGAVEAVTEKISLGRLLIDLNAGSPFWKVLRNQILTENAGEQIATIAQDFNEWAVLHPERPFSEYINERPSAALSTFIATAVGVGIQTGVIHSAYRIAEKQESALIAERRGQFLQSLGENLNNSTILTKSPESVKSYIEHLKKDGDIQNVYIPVEAWDKLFQMDSSKAAMEILGTENQYAEAKAVNGDIMIPLEVYAEKLAGTAFHEQLMPDITFNPGELSARAAAEITKNFTKDVEEEAKIIEEGYKANDPVRKVYNDVYGQHIALGATRQEANRMATLVSQRQAAWADLLGKDAYELWQEKPIGFQRELPAVLQKKDVDIQLDPLLDQLRSGKGASQKEMFGASLTEFLKEKGGLLDQGTELSTKDVDVERKRSAKKLVQKEGMTLDNAAELAAEQGYIDEADINKLLDAIDRETRGEPVYVPGKENQDLLTRDRELNDLNDYLNSIGADLKTMDNAAVRKLIRERETGLTKQEQALYQTQDQYKTKEFIKWAGTDEPVIESDEINNFDFSKKGPFVMRAYHGTTHEFDTFISSIKGNVEGQFGAINYFTSSEADASDNYAGEGPDLTSRIEIRAERLAEDITDFYEDNGAEDGGVDALKSKYGEDVYDEDHMEMARKIVRKELHGGQERVMELVIKTEKPFVVGEKESPWLEVIDIETIEQNAIERVADTEGVSIDDIKANIDDYQDQIEEARYEIMDEQENPLITAVQTIADRYGFDAGELLGSLYDISGDGEIRHSKLEEYLRENESLSYAEHPETGKLIQSHMIGEIIQELGFDSIILKNANERFKNMNIEYGTAHIHVFDANNTNIKSATENIGTFDPTNPNILYQAEPTDVIYTPALRAVKANGSASVSAIRRSLPQISVTRAGQLIDKMLADGYIKEGDKTLLEGKYEITDKIPSNEDLLFQTEKDKGLYSQLRVAVNGLSDKIFQGSAANVKLHLMNNLGKYGIKKDEIFWTGLEEFLSMDKKVSKSEVLAFLDENAVQVKDVMLGKQPKITTEEEYELQDLYNIEDSDLTLDQRYRRNRLQDAADYGLSEESTKFAAQVLPGGRDYLELLITLPAKTPSHELRSIAQMKEFLSQNESLANSLEGMTDVEKLKALNKKISKEGATPTFTSSHYPDVKNLIAHVRLDTRDDAQGRTGTFMEEQQSDWGIAGSKDGFKKEITSAEQDRWNILARKQGNGEKLSADEIAELNAFRNRSRIPSAPFVTSATGKGSTAHTLLSLKKTILYAIEQGHEFVSWTTGTQQKDRYSLSKQIKEIEYQKAPDDGYYFINAITHDNKNALNGRYKERELSDVIGKDAAEKVIAGEKGKLSGLDLDIGGEWADTLYGDENGMDANGKPSLMSQAVKEVARQLGVELKVETVEIDTAPDYSISKVPAGWAVQSRKGTFAFKTEQEAVKFARKTYGKPSMQPGFTITPELRAKVTSAGIPLFQTEKKAKQPFGAYSREDHTITYFKRANPSTGLHELGHAWLEELRIYAQREDAPQKLLDMWATVKKEYGIEEGQISGESHEKFATSFETYVMEGKSPSIELRTVFENFKAWLIKIYRSLAPGEVSPAMREVFDRMLATEEQIDRARKIQGYEKPLLNEEGMTKAEYEAYKNINEKAKSEAEDSTRAKVMGELLREQASWWKKARAVMREDVAAEIDSMPTYRALSWLRKGAFPDGSTIEGIEPLRLSKDALVQRYGEAFLKSLPRPFIYQQEGGLHPDIAAEYLGFNTGEELVKALAESKPRNELIDAETDQRMKDKYGDMMMDGSIADEADFQVNNDRQAEVFMYEMKILKRRGSTRNISPKEVFQQIARSIIQDKKVGDLDPKYYEHAARKAGQEAEKALLGKDMKMGVARNLDLAFDAKQRQMLNLYLFKEAFLAKEKIDKAQDRFMDMFRKDEKLAKTHNMDMVNAARAISAQHGIGGTDQNAMAYLKQMREYDPETYEDMKMIVDLAISDSKPFKQLTVSEFGLVQDSIDGLWEISIRSQQITVEGKKLQLKTVIAELNEKMELLGEPKAKRGYDKAVTKWEKTKIGLLGAKAALRRVEPWVDAMDQGKFTGEFRRYIWQPISDATTHFREMRRQTLEKYLELVKPIEGTITRDKIAAPEIGYTFGNDGSGRSELLGALLHTGNESNLQKLLRGRKWGEYREDGTLDTSRWDAFIQRMHNEGILTKRDYDFVQSIWDLNESLKPDAQKAHKAMYGYYFDEITAQPFQTPFGEYKGGYMPAIVDPFIADDAALRSDKEALEGQSNSFMFPTTGRGFTKSRKAGYAKPLMMDLRYIPSHLDKVLKFSHIEPRVKEVGRLVMNKDFRAGLADYVDTEVASQMLVPWLQRAARQTVETASMDRTGRLFDKFWKEVRSRTGLQIMTLNVTNALQQFTGLSIAAIKVKPSFLAPALGRYVRGPHEYASHISEKSEFMRNRVYSQSFEIQEKIDNILLDPTKMEKARDYAIKHGYFLQAGTQHVVDIITWGGAYDQVIAEGNDEQVAIKMADSAVRETQGTFAAEDISRFETGSPFMRAFTMFYTYFNMQANLLGTEFANAMKQGGFEGAGRGLYVYTLGFMIPAVLSELIVQAMAGKLTDEEDEDWADWLAIFFGGQGRTITAMVPGVGPAVQTGINAFNDKWYDDRMSTSPAVAMIESTVHAPFSIYSATMEDGSQKKAIKDTLTAIGMVTGLPVAPLGRPLGYLADIEQGKIESPESPIEFSRGLITGKSQ